MHDDCRQAPIGDDNYLHLAGAAGGVDVEPFVWRAWRGSPPPGAGAELDGASLPPRAADVASSTESLKLARHADERSSGKSNKSAGSGYLTMSCLKHEPSEDSDASGPAPADRPARPPKPARLSPSRASALCEYVDVEPKPPERRPKPDLSPKRPERDLTARCKEYELMANFMSHARDGDAPPAVPPRARPAPRPAPARTPPRTDPDANADALSNDDSLLDELQRDYCVLKVCEDDPPEPDVAAADDGSPDAQPRKDDCGVFSRISVQRKSNPIKTQSSATKPLKTSNSTSNVCDAGASVSASRPFTERLTPFFLKKKPKPPEEAQANKGSRKEDNLIGRLTPRFGQSRLYGRGQSLDLAPAPAEGRSRRIERSATTVNIPTRPINSSIVANLKFLSLHRYGAQEDVQCRAFVRTTDEEPAARAPEPGGDARAGGGGGVGDSEPQYAGGGAGEALESAAAAWRRPHAPSLLTATNDIRL